MTTPIILRPRLKRQIIGGVVRSDEDAERRSAISRINLSEFFKYLYASIYGGIVKGDPWGNNLTSQHNIYSFNPDIEREENRRRIYTEVKATSKESSKIHSSLKQESNNLCRLLEEIESRRSPVIEYALFKYGPSKLTGLHILNNSQLVKTLAKSEKGLVVVPLNLFFYLTTFSRLETRDQTTSGFSGDSQDYHIIRGGTLTKLMDYETFLENLHRNLSLWPCLRELCLEDIEAKSSTIPDVEGYYRTPFTVESFPVTKYSIPKKKYPRFLKNLTEHHVDITGALGIRDLLEEGKSTPF